MTLHPKTHGMANDTAELVTLPTSPWSVKVLICAVCTSNGECLIAQRPLSSLCFSLALYMMQATWALDFSKADYDTTNYTPLSGERWLRRKTGKEDGLITVPVMFTPEGSLYTIQTTISSLISRLPKVLLGVAVLEEKLQSAAPVLFLGTGTLMDSFDIAQWADAHSQRDDGAKLFPPGQLEVIKKYAWLATIPLASPVHVWHAQQLSKWDISSETAL